MTFSIEVPSALPRSLMARGKRPRTTSGSRGWFSLSMGAVMITNEPSSSFRQICRFKKSLPLRPKPGGLYRWYSSRLWSLTTFMLLSTSLDLFLDRLW
jgi:hypothetical protein